MFAKKSAGTILLVIMLLSACAAVFDYDPLWRTISSFRPWNLGLDLAGGSLLKYQIDLSQIPSADKNSVVSGMRDVIEKRVNLFGVSEPRVYTEASGDTSRLVVELAGVKDVHQAIQQIGATPYLDFRTVTQTGTSTETFTPTALNGRYVQGAQIGFNQTTRVPEIDFSLNTEGAKLFQEITKRNIGKPLCIFIDNQPIIPDSYIDSCPTVQSEIPGGKAVISGNFTLPRVQQIVERFNAGALPAPITLINQQTISPDFGRNALDTSIFAGILGTLAVMLFMILYYRKLGFFAAAALCMYIALTLAVFKIVPVTMTLSGIAGFILSIGMAVDANVLVFERTKEELKKGLSHVAAIEEGFKRAWTSIRDSNISTMITAAVLYYLTSSFVRGFALALFLGVVMSMFSAITITRTMLRVAMKRDDKKLAEAAAQK